MRVGDPSPTMLPASHRHPLAELLSRPAPDAAAELLGCRLAHTTAAGTVCVVLTEVEAYAGVVDPASHAFRGRTPRNSVMFGPPGHLYVYFSYGMHWCANVVCGRAGEPSALLLRAGRVIEGVDLARTRRAGSRKARLPDRHLARGPACLTQALGIDNTSDDANLLAGGSLQLAPRLDRMPAAEVSRGPRVGVSAAADVHWRYWLTADETVSQYKRSSRAP